MLQYSLTDQSALGHHSDCDIVGGGQGQGRRNRGGSVVLRFTDSSVTALDAADSSPLPLKQDTGFECDRMMIGCSALSPASLGVLSLATPLVGGMRLVQWMCYNCTATRTGHKKSSPSSSVAIIMSINSLPAMATATANATNFSSAPSSSVTATVAVIFSAPALWPRVRYLLHSGLQRYGQDGRYLLCS
ncbi:hypothetical protein E1301_Tti023107 [Triplophysa tibetana]|uniref:Uncharacterized protein n=1 Tax=Triplophysa tibetana TaxID=1572043 RepID=A0A5A9NTR7_9TELE|nr:hypothetical protein E1301_Tti023107 [Triplophysa tibetana]